MIPQLATYPTGEWQKTALSQPITTQVGDKFRVVGSQLIQERNGNVIAVRDIGTFETFEPASQSAQTISELIIFRRTHVAGVAVTYTGGTKTEDNLAANYSDDSTLESSLQGLVQQMQSVNQNYALAKQLLMSAIIARDPTMNDPNRFAGSSISVDMAAAKQIQITLVDNFGG